jgi:hypothetical protein
MVGFYNHTLKAGLVGLHKFHFQVIRDGWLKVDIQEALVSDATLMFPNDAANHSKVGDVVNGNALWNMKYVKAIVA